LGAGAAGAAGAPAGGGPRSAPLRTLPREDGKMTFSDLVEKLIDQGRI
jgi:hypothetical protein